MPETGITFARYFADLPDPRVDRTKWHRLDDILVITLCAVICGADSFEQVERFGKARKDWLRTFLHLPGGFPATTRSTGSWPPWIGRRSRPVSPGG